MMADSGPSGQTVKLCIEADAQLAESLSDYLVGVHGAAVEFKVDENSSGTTVHAFMQLTAEAEEQCRVLEQQISAYAAELAAIFQLPEPRVSSEIIKGQDWATNWQQHFKAFEIIPGLVIAPSWEIYQPAAAEQVLVMDPGMAFGTGQHPTTRLCLRLLQAVVEENDACSVLDVGTGTGILGMAAALFGAARVIGIDNDPEAVAAAAENIRRNNLGEIMSVSGTDLDQCRNACELVVANIVHDVLLELADELTRLTRTGGYLVLSGLIYGSQTDNLKAAFMERGFRLLQQEQEEEWGSLLLQRMKG